MITREEALRRLERIANDLVAFRETLVEGWAEMPASNPTNIFLEKCGGWEDTRSSEEIITDIYEARTASHRGAALFSDKAL